MKQGVIPMQRNRVRVPMSRVMNKDKNKTSSSKRKKGNKKSVVRGTEVSVTESSSERQLIYGRMKVGGVITFIETSKNSHAYLVTGEGNRQIAWTARTAGASGNQITITIVLVSNNASITVGVVGNAITVTLRSSSGTPQSTADQVINAIRANGSANALVGVNRADGNGSGIVLAQETTALQNGGGTWLHSVHTIAGHEIDAIEKVYLDNREVEFGGSPDPRWGTGIWNNKVFCAFMPGTDNQEAQPDLMVQLPDLWTSDHRQRGCALDYIINVYNENLYTLGFPEASFLVRGAKVYDPRSGLTVWSQNSALIVADFLTNTRYGYGIAYSKINEAALIDAADICDEQVALAAGGTESRYTTNGACDFGDVEEILSGLLDAMDGTVVQSDGEFFIYAGAYITPDVTITVDDLRGAIQLTSHVSNSDSFNCVRATYAEPLADYKETDAPMIKNSTYISEDGEEVTLDLSVNWVTSGSQVQRLMKIQLEKVRQGQTLLLPLKMSGLLLQAGQNATTVLPEFGFNKTFRVEKLDMVIESDGVVGVDAVVRETASGTWDWNEGEETEVDLSPNTNLPDPTDVDEPTGLTLSGGTDELDRRNDGTIFSRLRLDWDLSTTDFIVNGGFYEIQYKKTADSDWLNAPNVPGYTTFTRILDLKDETNYDVQIRAVTGLGYVSDWVQSLNFLVEGKSQPPSDVTALTAVVNSFGVIISCDPIADLDADLYEFRYTTTGEAWADATLIAEPARSPTINWKYQTAGVYTILAKAIDTSGNYSTNADEFELTIPSPSTPTVTTTLDGRNIIISWTESTSLFGVKEYEIRYGSSYNDGITLAVITGLKFQTLVNWGGNRTFYVVARDIANNNSTPGSSTRNIQNPGAVVNLTTTVTQNTVLLDWEAPEITSLPIESYKVYKGDDFETATLIGAVTGTFNAYVEEVGGIFMYHVRVVDSAGNESIPSNTFAAVTVPSDYYALETVELKDHVRSSLHVIQGGTPQLPGEPDTDFYLPVASYMSGGVTLPIPYNSSPVSETFLTWEQFFELHGFENFQDAINAGYTIYLTPSTEEPGHLEFEYDYGEIYSGTFIQFSYDQENFGSSAIDIVSSISYSIDGTTWTTVTDASQLFISEVRYVRYRIDFEAADDKSVFKLSNFVAVLSAQREYEYRELEVLAADSGGTRLTFEKNFINIDSIQVTPIGTSGAIPVKAPGATNEYVDILLFDTSNTRIDGTVSVAISGATSIDL